MASREDGISNCRDSKEALSTKVESCKNTSDSILSSSAANEEHGSVKKEPNKNLTVQNEFQCSNFYASKQSSDIVEGAQDNMRSNRLSKENNNQLEWLDFNDIEVKQENLSTNEESDGPSRFDVLCSGTSQTTSNVNCATTCDNNLKYKNDSRSIILSSTSRTDNASPPAPSKQKLRNTKRRAGILYKQITSSKLSQTTSKYFSQAQKDNKNRWIPPRSPYALVQEDLFDKPWQLLIATIFLTKTTAKKAIPQLHKFLTQYPRPEDILNANYEDIDHYFQPLGLTTTRSHIVMRFTVEFLEKDWTYPRELYGIGKYGDDSYRIFCINEWRQVSPDDIPLTMYRNWLLENAHRLGLE